MMKIKESSVISEKKVEIHLLFFILIFKEVVSKNIYKYWDVP